MKKIIFALVSAIVISSCGVGSYSISSGKPDVAALSFTSTDKQPIVVHIDGKCPFYRAYPRGVKRKNRQNSSENVMLLGSTRYDFVKYQRKVAQIS